MEKDIPMANELKREVQQHWQMDPSNTATRYARSAERWEFFRELRRVRYANEPNIFELPKFEKVKELRAWKSGSGPELNFGDGCVMGPTQPSRCCGPGYFFDETVPRIRRAQERFLFPPHGGTPKFRRFQSKGRSPKPGDDVCRWWHGRIRRKQ